MAYANAVVFPCATGYADKTARILPSFYPMYIMALNVTKGVPGVSVSNLTPPATGCLHDYALTTSDLKKIADADIFIANGAGMEGFLDNVIRDYPDKKIVTLSDGVSFIKEDKGVNPHVWVSVSNAIMEVKNFGAAMERLDPVHAVQYNKNMSEYVNRLEALRKKMQGALAAYKGSWIVTFHEAFPYFARDFGFRIAAVIERNPGSEPGARELAGTIDIIKKTGAKALFVEPQYSAGVAGTIAGETGAKVFTLDPAVTGPDDSDAYINIMEGNLAVLKEALQGRKGE